jgi:hypothetical protein
MQHQARDIPYLTPIVEKPTSAAEVVARIEQLLN